MLRHVSGYGKYEWLMKSASHMCSKTGHASEILTTIHWWVYDLNAKPEYYNSEEPAVHNVVRLECPLLNFVIPGNNFKIFQGVSVVVAVLATAEVVQCLPAKLQAVAMWWLWISIKTICSSIMVITFLLNTINQRTCYLFSCWKRHWKNLSRKGKFPVWEVANIKRENPLQKTVPDKVGLELLQITYGNADTSEVIIQK